MRHLLGLYRSVSRLIERVAPSYLLLRARRGKEDPARMAEKLGVYTRGRPEGPLIWIHGASVGESVSALPLIDALLAARPTAHLLVTTGTVTSAQVMADRLPDRAFHQYVPIDTPGAVRSFYAHWRPDLGLILESELWPNLLAAAPCRMALVNARLSRRSFQRWQKTGVGRKLLSGFQICLAQDASIGDRLKSLGALRVEVTGNLKFAAPPLPVGQPALDDLRTMIGNRPAWLAASTHEGEEDIATTLHQALRRDIKGLLTLIVPRHPQRGPGIVRLIQAEGLKVARRSTGEKITPETEIYVADTIGEMGALYSAVETVFVGGSLVPHGGQNPMEPAQLGCAICHGPHVQNFQQIYRDMDDAGGSKSVEDANALRAHLRLVLNDPAMRTDMKNRAGAFMAGHAGVLDRIMALLEPLLPSEKS